MKKVMKKILRIFIIVLTICTITLVAFMSFLLFDKNKTLETPLYGINLSDVSDGTYQGSYTGGRWSNTVSVTIKSHAITNIEVVDSQVFMSQETRDKLISRLLEKQNTDIDTVSGATVDSKAFLSAVENALENRHENKTN